MNISSVIKKVPPFFRRRRLVDFLVWLSPSSKIQQIEMKNGARLFADVSDRFPKTYFVSGGYDGEFYDIAAFFLERGGVFFDAGANFGFCSFGLMAEIPRLRVEYHLFEANLEICKVLEKSTELQSGKKINVTHACLADRPGVSRLEIHKGQLSSSFISEKGTQSVNNLLLDDYIEEKGIQKIDFLKLDVEGYELPALKGACKSLDRGMIKAIYLEVSGPLHEHREWKTSDLLSYLKEKGYGLFYVKKVDFEKGFASAVGKQEWQNGARKISVSPLKDFPARHQTDILAVHPSAGFGL